MIEEIFNFQDLSGTFSTIDVVLGLTLSFVLVSFIGWIYQKTHKGTSYTQSYVQTLVLMALIVDVIMLVVGSNIARAFSLVGALSIIRFRNAMKETRDVGFIFFAMAIGMATGTKFYFLAIVATLIIGMIIYIMYRFDWYSRPLTSQILKVQVNNDLDFEKLFNDVFVKYTESSDLISVDSVRSGMLTELVYNVKLKKNADTHKFFSSIKIINGNLKVTLITGYNTTDL
ncbi:MAG: DUF4956 domain-containing protein [Candidatus Methanofastidiosa archaeon]|jgi:uncharacterized membrane protein YhiD involved in acid resistance|nr:DUF4956 domain-containing protein [Candidatus Methanofastidiosa archaeon]